MIYPTKEQGLNVVKAYCEGYSSFSLKDALEYAEEIKSNIVFCYRLGEVSFYYKGKLHKTIKFGVLPEKCNSLYGFGYNTFFEWQERKGRMQ